MTPRHRTNLFYILTVGGALVIIYLLIHFGTNSLEVGRQVFHPNENDSPWKIIGDTFTNNLLHPLAILLLQIVAIILAARIFSWLFRKIGQPAVIGEIIAGIVLGPSLIGYYFPDFSAFLFPVESLSNLHFLSQIGLILFMFVVGMELDLSVLKKQVGEVVVVSHASIVLPFLLGISLGYFLYSSFAPAHVSFISFGLFLGISMSITAFPVLARIVQERGIHKTKLGTIVITAAAIDDISAWSLLAVVIAIVKAGSLLSAVPTVIMAVIYVMIMLKLIRPFLKRLGDLHASRESLSKSVVSVFFLILILSSYATEVIGIHALFGAFMAGMIMPDNQRFKHIFIEKVEDVALVLLLPLFFIYTGLRTEIGLLDQPEMWLICLLVIVVAVSGKFAGSALAARFIGQSWKDSLYIGALMNTRGLVELVALNIGYDLGVISPVMFAMLVIMALSTTFMTAPALYFIDWLFRHQHSFESSEQKDHFRILLSFGKPEMGKSLLRLASKIHTAPYITALHLTPSGLFSKFKLEQYEKDAFRPIDREGRALDVSFLKSFKVSSDIPGDIADSANKGDFNLLLVGIGQSIFKGSLLGNILGYSNKLIHADEFIGQAGKDKYSRLSLFPESTRTILMKSKVPVGILIENELSVVGRVVFLSTPSVPSISQDFPIHFDESVSTTSLVLEDTRQLIDSVSQCDLVVMNQSTWSFLMLEHQDLLAGLPSILILIQQSEGIPKN